jgi:hypothetical protein
MSLSNFWNITNGYLSKFNTLNNTTTTFNVTFGSTIVPIKLNRKGDIVQCYIPSFTIAGNNTTTVQSDNNLPDGSPYGMSESVELSNYVETEGTGVTIAIRMHLDSDTGVSLINIYSASTLVTGTNYRFFNTYINWKYGLTN